MKIIISKKPELINRFEKLILLITIKFNKTYYVYVHIILTF